MSETGFEDLLNMDDEGGLVDPEMLLQQMLEDPNLVQHITRTEEAGVQTVVAYFRVEFAAGQQRQILHVPFAPPFKVVPQVDAHATDHQDVRIRVTDCQKFGVRTEIILDQPATGACKRLIEFVATEVF